MRVPNSSGRSAECQIFASDIDASAVQSARFNAAKAGVADIIRFTTADVRSTDFSERTGLIATNPPYAVRMGEQQEVRALYRDMGKTLLLSTAQKSVISSDDDFERYFGKRAQTKRKLYNGSMRCNLYKF